MRGGRRLGAGRKPELGVVRTKRVFIDLSDGELLELDRAAREAGEPRAKWAREQLLAAARLA